MTRLAERLAKALEPSEQDAVLGDLIECRLSSSQVLFELTGLVVRRQLRLWQTWRTWLLFLVIAVPLALVLCLTARKASDRAAMDAWFYISNWTPGYLSEGFRIDLLKELLGLLTYLTSLFCCAWTSGMILRYLLRRAVWLAGILFFFLLVCLTELMILKHWMGITVSSNGVPHARLLPHGPPCQGAGMPLLFIVGLVVVPAFSGMIAASRLTLMAIFRRRLMFVCMTAATMALLARTFSPALYWTPLALSLIAPLAWQILKRYETTQLHHRNAV